MLAIAGGIALILGTVGTVSSRIRSRSGPAIDPAALGAQQAELRRMFVGRRWCSRPSASPSALRCRGPHRFMTSLLFESPLDATTYAAVAMLLLMVAALASYVPAHRATGVDPVKALRAD